MRSLVPVLTIVGLVAAMATPAAAFHGTPYLIDGQALFKPTGQMWNARLEWGGNGAFRVTLSDPVSGVNMPVVTVQGREGLNGVQFPLNIPACSQFEIVAQYSGTDSQTGGKMLDVRGIQENCLGFPRDQDRYMHVVGTFMQHWVVDLDTGTLFGTQWEQGF